MDLSSYLLIGKKKRINLSWRKMEKHTSSPSNISTDSLELGHKQTEETNQEPVDENVDTILVPFYENDVLIRVPKNQKPQKNQKKHKKQEGNKNEKLSEKNKKEPVPNYLVNKNKKKSGSYLEMFRRQFTSPQREPEQQSSEEYEISSVKPEFGDTERESIGEDVVAQPPPDFYNTESYNEVYYEKLLNEEIAHLLDNSYEEGLAFNEEIRSKSPGTEDNNLRSVSEVTQHRRQSRKSAPQPAPNVKLGGLGPDVEKIKPRLERARSLQRYSERVRMENRLKIYKKSVQADNDREKRPRERSARRQESARNLITRDDQNASYLVNKSQEQKIKVVKKVYETKSKSASALKTKESVTAKESSTFKEKRPKDRMESKKAEERSGDIMKERSSQEIRPRKSFEREQSRERKCSEVKLRVKSGARSRGINTEGGKEVPPVQISFLVNVGGVRPSSALKTLEEKHRMYQEQVKAFTLDNN